MAGPVLEIVSGELQGRKYRVEDERFVIGRAPSCDLVIPKRYISREHAKISRAGRDYVIDGLSEKNPILLRDRPVRPGHRLADGDEFEVCGIKIRFLLSGDAGARKEKGTAMSGSHHPEEDEDEKSFGPGKGRGGADDSDIPTRRSPPSDSDQPVARRRDEPSDEDDIPKRRSPPSDEDDIPRRKSPPSDEAPVTKPVNTKASAPGKVVFDEEPDEQTKALATKPKSTPVGSGSQKGKGGSGESHNERTAELGKVHDPNDPDYDPFAEVDSRKKKEKKGDAGREKALRGLMVVGFLGIVLAAGIVYQITKPKPWVVVYHEPEIRLAKGQTLRFEEPWSQIDPPDGRQATRRDGEPYIFFQDGVVEVEWAVPHTKTKCVFLIRGLEQGSTMFQLTFSTESRRVKRFNVVVDGDDPHEVARERRRAELAQKSPRELQQLAKSHLDIGETLYKEREVMGKEGNLRQAWLELRQASDAAVTLHRLLTTQGTVPADLMELIDACDDAEERAATEYEEFVNREFARYRGALTRSAQLECVEQLRRTLRAINHDCDPRFQRLRLILEESFQVPWAGDGTEICGER
jgi:pSer/pThr/pTyr-binding forkhead associated (FHA) protein